MRLLILGAALWVAGACASPQMPPGGPVDDESPQLVRVRPDSNATGVDRDAITFEFDEVVSERPQGSPTLADLFLISPSTGNNSVSWRRTRLEVKPRGGLRPNTTYTVAMLPGLTDLDGNVDSVGTTIVFSTGPTLANGRLRGVVFDWMAERVARRAFVEAIALPDSTRYLGFADTTGHYAFDHLPQGTFLLRALVDQNRNRLLDPRELYDTMTVVLTDSTVRDLHTISRDTIGPGIERVELADSLTLRARFDRALDTALVITPASFTLKRADSSVVAIASAVGGRAFQRQKAVDDSVRAVQRADSIRRADSLRTGGVPAPARPQPVQPVPPRDTVVPALKPSVRLPENEVILLLQAPLPPQSAFRLRAEGMRSVVGRERSSERTFTTPRRRAADSTGRDSAAARDTGAAAGDRRRADRGEGRVVAALGGPPHRENIPDRGPRPNQSVAYRIVFPQTRH